MLEQLRIKEWNWFGHMFRISDDNACRHQTNRNSGRSKATEEDDNPGILGEEIWRKK